MLLCLHSFWSDKEQKNVTEQVPVPIQETWQALESLVKTPENPSGILRSIGVANFNAMLLYDVLRCRSSRFSPLDFRA